MTSHALQIVKDFLAFYLHRTWIDKYEEAMTNQYSPELLLRLSNLKVNGLNRESVRRASSQLRLQLCRVAQVTESCKV